MVWHVVPMDPATPSVLAVWPQPQMQLMQREAELAEHMSSAGDSSRAWQAERQGLTEVADKWRSKAIELQQEVRVAAGSARLQAWHAAQALALLCTPRTSTHHAVGGRA
jgi:hypothetical protein